MWYNLSGRLKHFRTKVVVHSGPIILILLNCFIPGLFHLVLQKLTLQRGITHGEKENNETYALFVIKFNLVPQVQNDFDFVCSVLLKYNKTFSEFFKVRRFH